MEPTDHPPGGWLGSLHRFGDSLLGLAQSRLELFAVELQEEKLRAVNLLAWLAVAFGLALAGLLIGLATLALYLWQVAGYAGLAGLAVAALAGAGGIVWRVRRQVQTAPPPFSDTIAEFKKDRKCLHEPD